MSTIKNTNIERYIGNRETLAGRKCKDIVIGKRERSIKSNEMCIKNERKEGIKNRENEMCIKNEDNEREILLDWIYSLWEVYSIPRESFNIVEDYITKCIESGKYTRKNLQLMGTACFYIAAKLIIDISLFHPTTDELVYFSHHIFSSKDIINMEMEILELLEWNLIRGYIPN